MIASRWRGRGLRLGVALGLVAALATSCSPSTFGGTEVTVGDDGPSTEAGPAEVDGETALVAALDAARAGYVFESVVTLDGEVVTTVFGRVVGNALQAMVETGGAEVEYLSTPDGRWLREPGEEWLALQDAAPVGDPLAPLGGFQSVAVGEESEGRVVLIASYSPDSLGLESEDVVEVEVVVVDGVVARVSYSAEAQGRILEVVSTFTDIGTAPPVTGPDT